MAQRPQCHPDIMPKEVTPDEPKAESVGDGNTPSESTDAPKAKGGSRKKAAAKETD